MTELRTADWYTSSQAMAYSRGFDSSKTVLGRPCRKNVATAMG